MAHSGPGEGPQKNKSRYVFSPLNKKWHKAGGGGTAGTAGRQCTRETAGGIRGSARLGFFCGSCEGPAGVLRGTRVYFWKMTPLDS